VSFEDDADDVDDAVGGAELRAHLPIDAAIDGRLVAVEVSCSTCTVQSSRPRSDST